MSHLVLIVDDNDDVRFLYKVMLKKLGVEVKASSSGNEALQYLKDCRDIPDLILVDYNMGELDGISFTKLVRQSHRLARTRIYIISGEVELPQLASQSLADGYLAKPFTIDELRDLCFQQPQPMFSKAEGFVGTHPWN